MSDVAMSVKLSFQALSQLDSHQHEVEEATQRLRTALEDTQQENTELLSKVNTPSSTLPPSLPLLARHLPPPCLLLLLARLLPPPCLLPFHY